MSRSFLANRFWIFIEFVKTFAGEGLFRSAFVGVEFKFIGSGITRGFGKPNNVICVLAAYQFHSFL